MRLKTIVLAVISALMMATIAQAELSGYFSQGMNGTDFVPIAKQSSMTNLQAGPLQFSGSMVGQISTFKGDAQTDSNQFVAAQQGGVVISNSNQAVAQSGKYGSSFAGAGNTTNTNLPFTYVYTDQLNQAQTSGNAVANSAANSVIFVSH